MTRTEFTDRYFRYLCELVADGINSNKKYSFLLTYLFTVDFRYSVPMDSNRESDGIEMRYTFGRGLGVPDPQIAAELDIRPCSVLEMMVALAVRIDDSMFYDFDEGLQAGRWFWKMVESMGLINMDDRNFNAHLVSTAVENMLSRQYRYDGRGGLFWIPNTNRDIRDMEIWYQANYYLEPYSLKE